MTAGGQAADQLPEDGVLCDVSVREEVRLDWRPEFEDRLEPGQFLRGQHAKHAHVQVHQVGPADARWYVVIGYDEHWNESERTHLTEDGRILAAPLPSTDP